MTVSELIEELRREPPDNIARIDPLLEWEQRRNVRSVVSSVERKITWISCSSFEAQREGERSLDLAERVEHLALRHGNDVPT